MNHQTTTYLQNRTNERAVNQRVFNALNPYNAVHDITEKDTARATMYQLRSKTAEERLRRQEEARRRADLKEWRDIVLCYIIPFAVLSVTVVYLYHNFR